MEQAASYREPTPPVTPLAALDHHGRHLIQTIHEFLMIDEEWTRWEQDGFTWWSHGLAQRFRVEGPVQVDDIPTWWVSFDTSVLRNVPEGASIVTAAVALQSRMNNLFTTKVEAGRLLHWGRVYALPETATSRARMLAERAIISNVFANEQSEALASFMSKHSEAGFLVDATEHPEHGARTEPDDMLSIVRRVYAPVGSLPLEPGRRPDLEALAGLVHGPDSSLMRDDRGLNLGVLGTSNGLPYGVHLDLTARHPVLGVGMLVLLRIQLGTVLDDREARELATKLNDGEGRTSRPLISLGSWSTATKPSTSEGGAECLELVHATFHPAASLNHQAAVMALADAMQRTEWLSSEFREA